MMRGITLALLATVGACSPTEQADAGDSLVVRFDAGPPPPDLTCDLPPPLPDHAGPPQLQGSCPATVAPVIMDTTLIGYVDAPAPAIAATGDCPYPQAPRFVAYVPLLLLQPLEVTVTVDALLAPGNMVSVGISADCQLPVAGPCGTSFLAEEALSPAQGSYTWPPAALWPGTFYLVIGSSSPHQPVTVSIKLRATD